jgi:hypothetical protein
MILAISLPAAAADGDKLTTEAEEQAAPSAQAPGRAPQRPAPTPPAQQRPAPTTTPERIRRASLVGYITDATIESQVRVRFDAGFHNNVPDRAEFFYAQCGCNFTGAPGPGALGAGDLVTDLNFQQLTVDAQYAVRSRIAVFAAIPARFVQPKSFLGQTFKPPVPNTFQDESGIGDVRAGVKAAIVSDADMILTAQVQGYFQTGDGRKGLGTDHASVEMALLFNQKLSDRLGVEAQFGDWHPIGGSNKQNTSDKYAGDVLFYGIGPSYELVKTARLTFAPVIELVGWHVLGGLQQVAGNLGPAEGTNIVNLKFGVRTTTFDGRNSFYLGYGRALTDAVWYSDIVRFEYRYSF